jgi:hypothetical protein
MVVAGCARSEVRGSHNPSPGLYSCAVQSATKDKLNLVTVELCSDVSQLEILIGCFVQVGNNVSSTSASLLMARLWMAFHVAHSKHYGGVPSHLL